jgi:hypothetical protein
VLTSYSPEGQEAADHTNYFRPTEPGGSVP